MRAYEVQHFCTPRSTLSRTNAIHRYNIFYLCKVPVTCCVSHIQFLLLLVGHPCQHAVEDVVVPLVVCLCHDPRLLQQVLLYLSALYGPFLGEVNVNVFSKSTGVVIPDCFCISKSCKQNKTVYEPVLN